jgi:hypothetical protein
MSKIAVAAIALFLVCTRPVPVDAVPPVVPLAKALAEGPSYVPAYEGCWRPPSRINIDGRNIGIAELSCDALAR